MADSRTVGNVDFGGMMDINLAIGVVGYVGAAETARALKGVIGIEAVKEIEARMLGALERMNADAELKSVIEKEIRDIFAR